MNKVLPIISCLFLLCFSHSMQAQILSGTVTDAENNQPLEAVMISVMRGNITIDYALTDAKGRYSLAWKHSGTLQLSASLLGYKREVRDISTAGTQNFNLQSEAIALKEVQIRPGRIHTRKDTVRYDLAQFASSKDVHIKDVLKKLPGVDVDENGIVKLDELEKAITPETILISVMFANNEIGSIQPIKEIGRIAKEHGVLFHTDAVQAFCQVPINVDECNIDMLSSSGHKINGPKGIGFLYIRKGVKIRSFVHGGAQERKRRAGTENVPGIVGYGAAAARANASMKERTDKEIAIRDHLIHRIETEIPYVKVNGDRIKRLPNNVNVSFQFVEGESLLLMLDNYGICASSGSACTSGSLDPSHVLLAIGLPHEIAHGSLRMTLSEETTMEDVDFVVDRLKEIVAHLRSMSPLYEDFMKKQNKLSLIHI